MAADLQSQAPGGAEGTSKDAFWAITGGGTVISLFIGWWLYWQASRKRGTRLAPETGEA